MITLGVIGGAVDLREAAKGKTGLDRVLAMMRALNYEYCWLRDREKPGTNWAQVNRHLWRIHAMYEGGDCFLADFPGAVPHQKLWPNKTFNAEGWVTLPGYRTKEN